MHTLNNKNTVYLFLVLILSSWVIELGVGWKIMQWWFNTAWFSLNAPGSKSFAATLASWGSYTVYSPNGTVKRIIDFHWTPLKVTLFFYVCFLAVHVVLAVWSGFLYPFIQRWNQGVRYPIAREQEQFEAACAAIVRNGYQQISRPRVWLVSDGSGLDMRWHGYKLIIDRELLRHRFFVPLLAVQLGHVNSEDRLAHRLYEMLPRTAGIIAIVVGWPFALGHVLLYPLWMWYWKERVYAADAFAVEHGQGHGLVRALDQLYLRADMATRGGRLLKPVPYVAQRIGRIQQLLSLSHAGAQRMI